MVTPTQIMLPAGPLAAAMNRTIMIRNGGTNALVLSDATVNIPGAEVRMRETQPGRLFNLTVSFPAGFDIKPDQIPLTDAQKHELERRLAAHKADPSKVTPWEAIKAEALARVRK